MVITGIFATYPAVLVPTLLLAGGLSDVVGRRRVMLGSILLIAISAILFAAAPNVWFLFAGRALQGIGAGLAMGTASAALVENNVSDNHRLPSSVATVATSTGLAAALAITGTLAQFLTPQTLWSYVLLLVLAAATLVAVALTRDDRPHGAPRWRPRAPRLPSNIRLNFAISSLAVSLAYCSGAIFLSLGAHLIHQFVNTDSLLVTGGLLAVSAAAIGATGLLLHRVPAHTALWIGTVLTLVGLALMAAIPVAGSLWLFLAWCVVGGVAYSFAFTGGLGLINRATPAPHRGATLSMVYLVAYLLQAVTAVGVGSLATVHGLEVAITLAAVVLAVLCLVMLALLVIEPRRAARTVLPVADPTVGAHGSV